VLDRLANGPVAGAPAQVPLETLVELLKVVVTQRRRRDHHSRRAEPALESEVRSEGLLDEV
jgi:hypothetical protein